MDAEEHVIYSYLTNYTSDDTKEYAAKEHVHPGHAEQVVKTEEEERSVHQPLASSMLISMDTEAGFKCAVNQDEHASHSSSGGGTSTNSSTMKVNKSFYPHCQMKKKDLHIRHCLRQC